MKTEIDNPERKFLHDVASPIGTAIFLADILSKSVAEKLGDQAMEAVQMTKLCGVLDKIRHLLAARRQLLIEQESQKSDASSKK